MVFKFDNDSPIYVQIVEQLKLAIINGTFSPGEKIPSVRELAEISKVNPNTMQRALVELEDLKLVFTERTNGKFTTTDTALIENIRQQHIKQKTRRYLEDMETLGADAGKAINIIENYIKENGK